MAQTTPESAFVAAHRRRRKREEQEAVDRVVGERPALPPGQVYFLPVTTRCGCGEPLTVKFNIGRGGTLEEYSADFHHQKPCWNCGRIVTFFRSDLDRAYERERNHYP